MSWSQFGRSIMSGDDLCPINSSFFTSFNNGRYALNMEIVATSCHIAVCFFGTLRENNLMFCIDQPT